MVFWPLLLMIHLHHHLSYWQDMLIVQLLDFSRYWPGNAGYMLLVALYPSTSSTLLSPLSMHLEPTPLHAP